MESLFFFLGTETTYLFSRIKMIKKKHDAMVVFFSFYSVYGLI
jgi:hypothetical protein